MEGFHSDGFAGECIITSISIRLVKEALSRCS